MACLLSETNRQTIRPSRFDAGNSRLPYDVVVPDAMRALTGYREASSGSPSVKPCALSQVAKPLPSAFIACRTLSSDQP